MKTKYRFQFQPKYFQARPNILYVYHDQMNFIYDIHCSLNSTQKQHNNQIVTFRRDSLERRQIKSIFDDYLWESQFYGERQLA